MINKLIIPTIIFLMIVASCNQQTSNSVTSEKALQQIAKNSNQWTGIAVSQENDVFVNFPYWNQNTPVSVGKIINGDVEPYPSNEWNNRNNTESFKAVQSVFIDRENNLWVLDTRNAMFKGVDSVGPILYKFNIQTNQLLRKYNFEQNNYTKNSYYNDVRIDEKRQFAFITDSGNGAIIVLNLKTGKARRLLDNHPVTHAESSYLIIDEIMWKNSIDSDGIALTPDRKHLYFTVLSGHTLYRLPTDVLRNKQLTNEQIIKALDTVMHIPATDGMLFDKKGNLWLGGLENNAINVLQNDGNLVEMVQDSSIKWADSFSKDSAGNIYFTTSQIHLDPSQRTHYEIMRINPENSNPKPLNKILMVITSHGLLGETGDSTGYYLSEVSHAYYTFKKAGFQITFASPQGGKSPIDGMKMDDSLNRKFMNDREAQRAIQNAIPAEEIAPEKYRAVYYAGGHGTMWDFPQNKALQKTSRKIYEDGGIISAVCHGPAGLVNIKLSDSSYLVKNKTVAGFTNEEEKAAGLDSVVPFLLETKLKKRGGNFRQSPKFQSKVVSEQRLVTGQNPASAKDAAERIVNLLQFNEIRDN